MVDSIPCDLKQQLLKIVNEIQMVVGPATTKRTLLCYAASLCPEHAGSESLPNRNNVSAAADPQPMPRENSPANFAIGLNEIDGLPFDLDQSILTLIPSNESFDFDYYQEYITTPVPARNVTPPNCVPNNLDDPQDLPTINTSSGDRSAGQKKRNNVESVALQVPSTEIIQKLRTHWHYLMVDGIFAPITALPVQTAHDQGNPLLMKRLQYHLILRYIDSGNDLLQWRRAFAEIQNLRSYTAFYREVTAQRHSSQRIRLRGETDSSLAQQQYLSYIYSYPTAQETDYDTARQGLKKDLQYGRRWSILTNGYTHPETGAKIDGLGSGLLLLSSSDLAKKIYNPSQFRNVFLQSLLLHITNSHPQIRHLCSILELAAENLLNTSRLGPLDDCESLISSLSHYLNL